MNVLLAVNVANSIISPAARLEILTQMLDVQLLTREQVLQQLQISPVEIEQDMLRGVGFGAIYVDELYQENHDELFFHCWGCSSGGPCGN